LKFLYWSKRAAFTVNCAIAMLLGRALAGHLLQPDHDELGRFEQREAEVDVDDAEFGVGLRSRLLVSFDEVRLARSGALERAESEQVVHERATDERICDQSGSSFGS